MAGLSQSDDATYERDSGGEAVLRDREFEECNGAKPPCERAVAFANGAPSAAAAQELQIQEQPQQALLP